MKKILIVISCIFSILFITACGSDKKTDSLSLNTPEETIEGFISALGANDAEKAKLYLSPFVREEIGSYLNQTDLQALAQKFIDSPPQRTTPSVDEAHYSIFFVEEARVGGLSQGRSIELQEINDQWYIVVF